MIYFVTFTNINNLFILSELNFPYLYFCIILIFITFKMRFMIFLSIEKVTNTLFQIIRNEN